LRRAAAYIGLDDASSAGFMAWILDLRSNIGIPHSLASIGIEDAQIARIAQMAVEDPSAAGNPVIFTNAQYAQILQQAISGEL
jgi:alcohol dehydrogenase class IV